jgi:hypothetical protein
MTKGDGAIKSMLRTTQLEDADNPKMNNYLTPRFGHQVTYTPDTGKENRDNDY